MRKSAFGRRNALIHPGVSRAGIALGAVVIVIVGIRVFAPGTIASLLSPFSYLGTSVATSFASVGSVVTGPAALQSALDTSKAEVEALSEQNRILMARVSDLEKLLGTRVTPLPGVVAGVIARPPQSPYDTLIIDQGTDARVGVGAQVMSAGGIPVGTVASVTARSSRVLLYSAPDVTTEAWIGEERTPLTITGTGAGAYSARAPRESVIAVGNQVYVPGPGSLPIATVVRVDSDPADPSMTVHLQSITNPFTITWVTVAPVVAAP